MQQQSSRLDELARQSTGLVDKGLMLLDLREQDRSLYHKTVDWIKTFTPEEDFEDSDFFLAFIEQNLQLDHPYRVFILYDPGSAQVIGTTSLVPDDQDVGKECGIEGIWVAGVNIRRELRNKGYGKILFSCVDDYLSDLEADPLRANLFVRNPIALAMYEKFGFSQTEFKVVRQDHEYVVCSKHYG